MDHYFFSIVKSSLNFLKMDNSYKQDWSRREFVSLITKAPLTLGLSAFASTPECGYPGFPAKAEFEIKGTYLNAAYTHPMSKGSLEEVIRFLNMRLQNRQVPNGYDGFDRTQALNAFAKLINASAEEIAWVPSTMVAENLIVSGLGLPGSKSTIVTDGYHFHGSLHLYSQLAKQGLNVAIVKPRNNKIDLNDLDKAIIPGTKLVALSLVSATTGFVHDLKGVCELAHARGAFVYADIIQAAGAIPINVRESGVDFCACATYKWLMGDFGIGFLYVKKDCLPLIKRTMVGYRQIKNSTTHVMPFDLPGENVFESESKDDMSGHFEVGTFANEGIAALRYSLGYLNNIGVGKITEYRRPMIKALQNSLPNFNYLPLTPLEMNSPIVSFAYKGALNKLKPRLEVADIDVSVYENMIRISPSIYNDMNDIDKLIEVLKKP
jgi:selenocysteine lyase/cysteine desulfurase